MAGIVGLGRYVEERADVLPILHALAADPRWRVREGVAMCFQLAGAADPASIVDLLTPWASDPDALVQRAVVAALCEPALLRQEVVADRVIDLLEEMTRSLVARTDRRGEGVRVLRQALGYGWSVAIVHAPSRGRSAFELLLQSPDPDVRWIVRENLGKDRLSRLDAAWVARLKDRLA